MSELPVPLVSVIIPAINEAASLPHLLDDLARQQGITLEIIIADGGSTDSTLQQAGRCGARHVTAPPGRGIQMNRGAAMARGEYVLFLHADSRLHSPQLLFHAIALLRTAEREWGMVAGHFRLTFCRCDNSNRSAYRFLEEKSSLNRANTTNGDQGLLLSRNSFFQVGGFDESLPFLEDQRIAEKIRNSGRLITLPGSLETSARRFESEGFFRRYLLMGMMMGLHAIGEWRFFLLAPEAYRLQQDTERLCLTPFFRLIRQMMRHEWGVTGTIKTFYHLGGYIRQNGWQLFFMVDVTLRPVIGPTSPPFLRLYDRILAPLLDLRVLDAAVGLCCFLWYLGLLAPVFRLLEHKDLHHVRP